MKKILSLLILGFISFQSHAIDIHVFSLNTNNPLNGGNYVIDHIKGNMGSGDIAYVRLLHNYGNRAEYYKVRRQGNTQNFTAIEISSTIYDEGVVQAAIFEKLKKELQDIENSMAMYIYAQSDQRGYDVTGTGTNSGAYTLWSCSSCSVTITSLDGTVEELP